MEPVRKPKTKVLHLHSSTILPISDNMLLAIAYRTVSGMYSITTVGAICSLPFSLQVSPQAKQVLLGDFPASDDNDDSDMDIDAKVFYPLVSVVQLDYTHMFFRLSQILHADFAVILSPKMHLPRSLPCLRNVKPYRNSVNTVQF